MHIFRAQGSRETFAAAKLSDRRPRCSFIEVRGGGGNRVWGWFLFVAAVRSRTCHDVSKICLILLAALLSLSVRVFYSSEIKYIVPSYWPHACMSAPRVPCDSESFRYNVDLSSEGSGFESLWDHGCPNECPENKQVRKLHTLRNNSVTCFCSVMSKETKF